MKSFFLLKFILLVVELLGLFPSEDISTKMSVGRCLLEDWSLQLQVPTIYIIQYVYRLVFLNP